MRWRDDAGSVGGTSGYEEKKYSLRQSGTRFARADLWHAFTRATLRALLVFCWLAARGGVGVEFGGGGKASTNWVLVDVVAAGFEVSSVEN